jgi:hypothetical protein
MTSKIYNNVLSIEEIESIISFYKDKPDAGTESYVVNKNLEYHRPVDFSYKLLNPKLNQILGTDHEFYTGAYKECMKPYPLHTDDNQRHSELGTVMSFSNRQIHNVALLIPLVEGPVFKTITFDIFSKEDLNTKRLKDVNELDSNDFTHVNNFNTLRKLPIDTIYNWKLGDMLSWDRDQYHISADFAKHGLIKKFLILFMA